MHGRLLALSVMCMAALWPCRNATAAVVTHTFVEDFLTGVSDGVAVPIIERDIAATGLRNGGVMVVPQPGTSVFSEDFNYADQAAAEAAGWSFNIITNPAAEPVPASSFSFSANPGSMRLSVGRPQDFHNPGDNNQRYPVLAYRTAPVTGDFIVETKMTFAEPRQRERAQGIFIGTYNDEFTPLVVDNTLRYIGVGTDTVDLITTAARPYENLYPWLMNNGNQRSQSYIIRVVKRGPYYYSFFRTSETEPWIFQHWFKAGEEMDGDPARPLVVGVYAKSWGGKNPVDDIQNVDFDYYRVSRLGTDLTGEYTNVLDAGVSASWRTMSALTHSMEGLRIQLRTGNTLAGGTLTDAGPFVGPDGTAATFFEEEVVNVIPNPNGKRYLEYKLFLDQTPRNLPASVLIVSADYDLAPLNAAFATDEDEWGAGGSGVAVQPGGGDLSLARTQVLLEDFSGTTLGPEWEFRAGDPTAVTPSSYTLTERPGYLRLKVGFPQDIFVGGNDLGGVAVMRTLPSGLNDFEIETEVNMEAQQARQGALLLWQDKDNYSGLAISRRGYAHYDIGVIGDVVLADGVGLAPTVFYGSNRMQLRVAKVGQVLTMSYRDAASPSPGWHVLVTMATAKSATGGLDFMPTHATLLSKSYGEADRGNVDVDYDYLKVSSIAATGTKDFTIPLPAGNDPDALLIYGEGVNPSVAKFQIKTTAGTFVGPDNTAATFFTVNEPKIPDALAGQTAATVRVQMNGAATTGVPYLHAAAIQYTTAGTRVERDSNATDFSGAGAGIDRSVPGLISGMVEFGTPVTENFTSQPADFLFSSTNVLGRPLATVSYDGTSARLAVPRPVDTWGGGDAITKERAFLYKDQIYTGNYEVETLVNLAEPRQAERHGGIAIVAARPAGTTTDDKIDVTNLLVFGPYQTSEMRFMHAVNNGFGDFGPLGWPGQKFYLKIRKTGNTFIGFAKVNEADPWTQVVTYDHPNLNNAYVGFLAKSWGGGNTQIQNYDFDYLKVTPIVATSGTYESRVLDLGATGLFPYVGTLGGNSGAVQIQWRAADTTAALATAPYVGPDGTGATTFAGNFTGFLPQSLLGKRYYQYKAVLPVGQAINDLSLVGLTTGPVSPLANAITALRIAGGLEAATPAQVTSLDLVKGDSAGKIEIVDAVAVARAGLGL